MHPLLAQLLTPDRRSVIYAIKGVISMALALYVSMYLQLDRPYWALVSAVFLQIRPQSGLVIEKALCQIFGSIVGAGVGILILAFLMPYPVAALICLTTWIGLNSAASSTVHNTNFIYAFAMAGMSAGLIVVLVMADARTVDSPAIFEIAQARISEIAVGALCALLVSRLLWPLKVKDVLRDHARSVINKTLDYLRLQLDPDSARDDRHQLADVILESLIALNDDSSAVVYEGTEGPGRGRAANLLCNKIMSLLAVIQILGRFQRNHAELVTPAFNELLGEMRLYFHRIAEANSYEESYKLAQTLRRTLLSLRSEYVDEPAIVSRLTQTSLELVADLVIALRAYNALENRDRTLLKAPKLETHRDPLIGIVNGFRTAVVFMMGAILWVLSASPAAIMLMILPVVYSIMFARFSPVTLMVVLRRLMLGAIAAIPAALFFGVFLLSQTSGDFEMLVLVLAGPYFVGLLTLPNRATLPYGLGFCVPFTVITQPTNHMEFHADTAVSIALGLFVGMGLLYWIFKLITPPDGKRMQRRLLISTAKDLTNIDHHARPEDWFNGRMGDRLLRLANYDQETGSPHRYMTDLGFTGLNLGHVSMRLRRLLQKHRTPAVNVLLNQWQVALADSYLMSSKGGVNTDFRVVSAQLLRAIRAAHADVEADHQTVIAEGMFERIALTFERTANTVAEAEGMAGWKESARPEAIRTAGA